MTDTPVSALRLKQFLPYQLSVTSNAVSNRISEVYQDEYGLKVTEWRIMAVLGDNGVLTQRQLTELTLMDKVAVNRACKMLEGHGLVSRAPNTQDGRSHMLRLTAKGQKVHDRVMPLTRAMERRLFETLDAAERKTFRALLQKLRDQAERLGPEISSGAGQSV